MTLIPDSSLTPSRTEPPGTSGQTPVDRVLELASAHVAARALHVVAELGIADSLNEEPIAAEQLARPAGVDGDALARVLRLLEAQGIFARDEQGRWRHTEMSRYLRSDHPMSLRGYARMTGTPFSWGSVTHLPRSVRSGEPGMLELDPAGPWAYLEGHPDESAVFQQAMTAKAHHDVAAVLDVYDFSRHSRIADVGGGAGHLIRAVLAAHPDASGVLFDLAEVAAQATPAPRLEVVPGDFFTAPLPACDAYMLMNVVHDWGDEDAGRILAAVADAGRTHAATVLVIETVMPDGPEPHRAKTLDVLMLAVTGGRERTLAEYDRLLDAAGIELVREVPTVTAFSIVEGRVR